MFPNEIASTFPRILPTFLAVLHELLAGYRGLFDGISGTWMRQMSYSVCRFWAYDESKKILGADNKSPAWQLALAGSMGMYNLFCEVISSYK